MDGSGSWNHEHSYTNAPNLNRVRTKSRFGRADNDAQTSRLTYDFDPAVAYGTDAFHVQHTHPDTATQSGFHTSRPRRQTSQLLPTAEEHDYHNQQYTLDDFTSAGYSPFPPPVSYSDAPSYAPEDSFPNYNLPPSYDPNYAFSSLSMVPEEPGMTLHERQQLSRSHSFGQRHHTQHQQQQQWLNDLHNPGYPSRYGSSSSSSSFGEPNNMLLFDATHAGSAHGNVFFGAPSHEEQQDEDREEEQGSSIQGIKETPQAAAYRATVELHHRMGDLAAYNVDLGHTWKGNEYSLCWQWLSNEVCRRIATVINKKLYLQTQWAREKMSNKLTTVLAIALLSGRDDFIKAALDILYSEKTQRKVSHLWRECLKEEEDEPERLVRRLSRITGKTPEAIRTFLSFQKVTAEVAHDLLLNSTDAEVKNYAIEHDIYMKRKPRVLS
ncbi:hypothetical protein CBS101457_003011 [Exobasidium rhododendri]|nr:hypothetical protein CBS101457_003011 [Exobasidium rhododendri]